jgi:hypothetical protein
MTWLARSNRVKEPNSRGERDGGHLRDSAQRLERVDNGSELCRCRRDGAIDSSFEPFDALRLVIDLEDVVEECRVLVGVPQLERSHPLPPSGGPRTAAIRRPLSVAQEVLAQSAPWQRGPAE